MKPATRAIHVAQSPDPATGAVAPPLYLTSTFRLPTVDSTVAGYDYTRSGHPGRDTLQEVVASLDDAAHAFAFSSGLAAEDTLLRAVLRPGDTVVFHRDTYGGTFRLLTRVYPEWGVNTVAVDLADTAAAAAQLARLRPRLVWAESPTNPLLEILDVAALAEATHAAGGALVVDNTFATPVLQQPLALGADAVVYSTTKYMGGHSDVVGGAVVVNDPALAERLAFLTNAVGNAAAPFDSRLTLRGIKTLVTRVRAQSASALWLAEQLSAHPAVTEVIYPGLDTHPGHALAQAQLHGGFGAMITLRLRDAAAARALAEGTELFTLAVSLGAVESLIEYPYTMTHAATQGTAQQVADNLVRLSIGLEDPADLLEDLTRALG